MSILEQWEESFAWATGSRFSPSGHAVAISPIYEAPGLLIQTLKVHFADKRPPLTIESDSMIHLLDWASDTEFIYRIVGQPLGKLPHSALWLLSLEDGTSSQVMVESEQGLYLSSVAQTGRLGHLSVLSKLEGKTVLFDLDVRSGKIVHLDGFDTALETLEVYPLFGHTWSEVRQEIALTGWPRGDYLEEGVEPTSENSHWTPLLDTPAIQDCVTVQPDGTRVTQRQLTQEAKRKKPRRLFILDAAGGCQEVPGTHHAHDPHWSPDGSIITYQEYVCRGDSGVWLLRRDDFALLRLGTCPPMAKTLMHPSGVLLAELEDRSLCINEKIPPRARTTPRRWREFRVQGGEVSRP